MPSADVAESARSVAERVRSGSPRGDWQLAETILAMMIVVWGDPSRLGGTRRLRDGTERQDPVVMAIGRAIGRTSDAVVLKVMNLRAVLTDGFRGMPGGSKLDREVVVRYTNRFDLLLVDCMEVAGILATVRDVVDSLVPSAVAAGSDTSLQDLISDTGDAADTVRRAEVLQRRGQNLFRARVLTNFSYQCGFCGLKSQKPEENSFLLIASHIRPWSKSSHHQRLDPANGLSLCAIHDRAFDWGFLTLSDALTIQASEHARSHYGPDTRVQAALLELDGKELQRPASPFVSPAPEYLEYHRKNVFDRRFRRV